MKQAVEAGHTLFACHRFRVLEERREPSDHAATVEVFGDREESLRIDAGIARAVESGPLLTD